jgi:hypothetical protein
MRESYGVTRGDRAGLEVDVDDLAEQHLGVLLAAEDLAGGWRDLALGQDPGRDLVEQRLEEMVAGACNEGDVHVGAAEGLGAEQPAETRADHHDVVAVPCRIRPCRHAGHALSSTPELPLTTIFLPLPARS